MSGTRAFLKGTPLAALLLMAAVPAGAQTRDQAPVSLPSSDKMRQDSAGSESWTYAQPAARFSNYRFVIVEPTEVYSGPDAQFDDIAQADRLRFASIITEALREEVSKTFPVPQRPYKDALRLKVTILGAETTKQGFATATRVTPFGFATSAVKSALGKEGSFTGSILYAVEVFDAESNELLIAAVRRRAPDPLDVPATLSTTETVKAVAREFADGARERLEALTGARGN